MFLSVNGESTYCFSADAGLDPSRPTALFIHGVLNDHSVWQHAASALAQTGWNVLAPDLPGHASSTGEPLGSVQDLADFVLALMDKAGLAQAALIGHSLGSLAVLQATANAAQRVTHLGLVGTAFPMRVSGPLLKAAQTDPMQALEMVIKYACSETPDASEPLAWTRAKALALGCRVMNENPHVNLLHTGLLACERYDGGLSAMARVHCPTLFLLGTQDRMTPPHAAQSLIDLTRQAQIRQLPSGHNLVTEMPAAASATLLEFLNGSPAAEIESRV